MGPPAYRDAIAWIALNDETAERDPEVMADVPTVVMVADLWRKLPTAVARDVLRRRKQVEG